MLTVENHPVLDAIVFETRFPVSMADAEGTLSSLALPELMASPGPQLEAAPDIKTVVRDLLRVGGFKPAGRNKPASEYVQKAIPEGRLGAINAAVDACNVASFHSGLPISVVDGDLATAPFRLGIAEEGTAYVFNASGQEIILSGLLCLFDADSITIGVNEDPPHAVRAEYDRPTVAQTKRFGERSLERCSFAPATARSTESGY